MRGYAAYIDDRYVDNHTDSRRARLSCLRSLEMDECVCNAELTPAATDGVQGFFTG